MGCDIHLYLEYQRKDRKNGDRDYWNSLFGRSNPGRNYWMFGLMSEGVRVDIPGAFPKKGLPDNISWRTRMDSELTIVDGDTDEEGACSLDQALRWAQYGHKIRYGNNGEPRTIEHPDWHSHSWLSTEEFKKVIELYNKKAEEAGYNKYSEPGYRAILAAMETLEENGQTARLIFWFDN